jgi:hypothetical protein
VIAVVSGCSAPRPSKNVEPAVAGYAPSPRPAGIAATEEDGGAAGTNGLHAATGVPLRRLVIHASQALTGARTRGTFLKGAVRATAWCHAYQTPLPSIQAKGVSRWLVHAHGGWVP